MKNWKVSSGKVLSLGLVVTFFYVLLQGINKFGYPPTMEELAEKHGYPLEIHEVETEDGWILRIHRIRLQPKDFNVSRPVVFLQHGLASSSSAFVAVDSETSLGLFLADKGYDVWMGNARGNDFSTKHLIYNTSQPEYWDFSFHEMGTYDLPVTIDYILKETGQKKIHYVGHSMGTTMLFVLLTEKPEYNKKIAQSFVMAPIIYFQGARSYLFKYFGLLYSPWRMKGGHQNWLDNLEIIKPILYTFCQPEMLTSHVCGLFYKYIFGPTTSMDRKAVQLMYGATSATSIKTIAHLRQIFLESRFRPWVNGSTDSNVPNYRLDLVTSPVTVMYADCDHTMKPVDVLRFHKSLPNAALYKVPLTTFNHADFIYGKYANIYVNNKIYRKIEEYRNFRKLKKYR